MLLKQFFPIALLIVTALQVIPAAAQDRPNVLFIAVDDLRPAMGCYGDDVAKTPQMDRLASSSLQFNKAYCQVAVCNPSRASLMTGQRPDKLGVWTLPIHFREAKPDATTLPQWFRKFGYTAVSHGKIYHNPTPDPQSWSEPIRSLPDLPYAYPEGTRTALKDAKEELPEKDWRKKSLRPPSTAMPDLPDDKLRDGAQTSMAIEDLKRLGKKDEPFFLAMGYIRPHLAWVAPKKYWDLYDPAKLNVPEDAKIIPDTPKYALHNNSELSHYMDLIDMPKPWSEETLSPEKIRHMIHGYYACVSYVDAQIGRLLDALEEEGLAKNTIVVLWSDHGYKLGEYRGWGKMTNYEHDTRVPMLISAPDMHSGKLPTAGQQTDQLAELLDVFPTLCELAKIDTPDFVDGKSLVPILANPAATVHQGAVSQYHRKLNGTEYMGYSIRTPTHRFVEWRDFSTGEVTARELYDHQTNGTETENIIESAAPGLVDEITETLLTTHPRKKLVMTPAVHANPSPGRLRAKITFSNQSDGNVRIIPISRTGKRSKAKIKRLRAGKQLTFNSRIGNVFVVESVDGKIHEIHSPSYPERTVVLGASDEESSDDKPDANQESSDDKADAK